MNIPFRYGVILLLLVTSRAFAQYSDEQLYAAYLKRDMSVWNSYITQTDWYKLSNPEKLRMLHYEFGYTAYALNQKQKNGRELLDQYEHHLAEMKPCLSEAMFLLYEGASHSYELNYNHSQLLKHAPAIYDCIDRAIALDPTNPVIVTMRGQLDLYSPIGNNKKALTYLLTADSLYHLPNRPYYQWNIRAEQMAQLICLQKLGKKEQALRLAHRIQEKETKDWYWLNELFLPELEK